MPRMISSSSGMVQAPELLAPAGDWECAKAAVENGADAIYFGLQVGFNARARASNFSLDTLPQLMEMLHLRGVKGYVTLNTLVFTNELDSLERNVRRIASAGVDAVLVQDVGAARLIRNVCPDLSIHASTQMTMTCAESIQVAHELGLDRVVLARELSLAEINKITNATNVPVETFVHGALCVAYSGQCLTSESLGGRSANRGQCAQACRLPYEIIVDQQPRDLGDVQYLLSPQDLAALPWIPDLIAAGVCSLKIEGRLKTPEYVANIVHHYRTAIDAAISQQAFEWTQQAQREMELSFSRGFSPGWLQGNDHKRLVPGLSSAKRGVHVGRVVRLHGEQMEVELFLPLAKGDGIVLSGNRAEGEEIGGRIYQVFVDHHEVDQPVTGRARLCMQHGLLKNAKVFPGQAVWQTDDPRLTKKLRATFESDKPRRKVSIQVQVKAIVGQTMEVTATTEHGTSVTVLDEHILQEAQRYTIDALMLEAQLSRLGGTVYELKSLTAEIVGQPMVPLSVIGRIRKEMVQQLDVAQKTFPSPSMGPRNTAQLMLNQVLERDTSIDTSGIETSSNAELWVLVRSMRQLKQVLELGARSLYADFHDLREYREAVAEAHQAGAKIYLASLRIHKPGENGLFLTLAKHSADGWLVRNMAAMDFAFKRNIPMVGDFSLNITNPLSAQWMMQRGLRRVTASYDLNRDQLLELVQGMPSDWLEVVVHQHMPMFHMEHCVFCSVVSPGTNKSNCGRPCDRHDVRLKDRVGVEHTLHADIGCRNTLYNGIAQSGAEAVRPLLDRGIRSFRIELLRDSPTGDVRLLLDQYRRLIAGELDGASVWKSLKAHNRVGVTRGTLEQPRNPLAVL